MTANSDRDDFSAEPSLAATPGNKNEFVDPHDCLHKLQQLQVKCDQLQQALSNERDISLAIGITMVQHRLSRAEAFSQLRNVARSRRCKLADLADEIVMAAQLRAQSKS